VRALLLERPNAGSDLLTERCSISWAVDLSEILSVEAVCAPSGAGGAGADGARKPGAAPSQPAGPPHSVVLQLRTKTKDRMLSGVVASRVFACTPGTEQAARLHDAIRDGLMELSTRVGLVRQSGGGSTAGAA
jgi:hypothetical protein